VGIILLKITSVWLNIYFHREAKSHLYKTITSFINDIYCKMGVHAVILTTHVDEKDQVAVSK